ncbi:hypothetical protein FIBSPDRAFT_846202 [Athelia psychrophila]|uniref:Uncharacterized protein n=1 Tax=Athelia psychrophila TaxID=1759441 RepID=A0A167SIH8_9AGAM|nr:hypothetical protein FIBSPDRAFT_846202 [Fibularhizoctonia sp. CBS 109695]
MEGRAGQGRAGEAKAVGVLEKKANLTVVGGEVVIGKEEWGNVKFNMLVSYMYRSDDPAPSDHNDTHDTLRSPTKAAEVKTFSFYTVVVISARLSLKRHPRLRTISDHRFVVSLMSLYIISGRRSCCRSSQCHQR